MEPKFLLITEQYFEIKVGHWKRSLVLEWHCFGILTEERSRGKIRMYDSPHIDGYLPLLLGLLISEAEHG